MAGIPGLQEFFDGHNLHFLFILIASSVSAFSFFYPTYYQKRSSMANALRDLITILESNESRHARAALVAKYDDEFEEDEDADLDKSANRIRGDLLLIQSMIDEKSIPRNVFQNLYSERMVRIILCYRSYMHEHHPDLEPEKPIKKLYKNSYRWKKFESRGKLTKQFESLHLELEDKIIGV